MHSFDTIYTLANLGVFLICLRADQELCRGSVVLKNRGAEGCRQARKEGRGGMTVLPRLSS